MSRTEVEIVNSNAESTNTLIPCAAAVNEDKLAARQPMNPLTKGRWRIRLLTQNGASHLLIYRPN